MGKRRKNTLQLSLNILPIDERATRLAVEEYLEEVRQYRQIGFVRREAAITQAYSYREHQSTNAISKPTENIALWNVDKEAELQAKDRLVEMALGKLSSTQREVIQRSYLDNEGEYDFVSSIQMSISDRTYRRVKVEALGILAVALKIEQYQTIEHDKSAYSCEWEVG
ncbi:ArpU family phage packaging/lysis transcriptional regulator [Paenibacillus sp. JX-17]|uniref:ArpU family phage packaging/lysis transcriptional regulator n=1 Tax=Paenibacillus lacisoli TaxID=3064525 RepID=A0ABT9CGS6_9BACL|nr:ArpU family phage packaging/lysis transcriptional regulator [Paenibacillus sp. JX-17]MDO7908445.1 ArpU family phage packaging/lysis transcriptional regulator [Paenibacillus sp. JX-17]